MRKLLISIVCTAGLLTGCSGGDPDTLNIDTEIQRDCEELVLERWNQDREPNADDVWGCINVKGGFTDEQGNVVSPKRYNYSEWKTVVP
jgi:hypothetical protein